MSVFVRFAPSPTGKLHIGNVRAALYNYLFARKHKGSFMLRLDDTDRERSKEEFAKAIEEDLSWLGYQWDRFERQGDRFPRYAEALETLKSAGRVYACFETADELALKRKTQLGRGLPPLYDRGSLKLSEDEKLAFLAAGKKPHWRFSLNPGDVVWQDAVQGTKSFPASSLSDPVLVREDGIPLYTFSSVVDDVDFGITDIIRGEDHVTNTAVQIQIWQALSQKPAPNFAHFPLIVNATGAEMSKRLGTLSISSLRSELEIEPMAINALLGRLGTSDPVTAGMSLEQLAQEFEPSKISHSTPKFDIEELKALNAKILHMTPFSEVKSRLLAYGFSSIDETFWNIARANITKLSEVSQWWNVVKGPLTPVIADKAFAGEALSLLPPLPWDETSWPAWTNAIKAKTGRKGKELFMPLRLALTGVEHGPEMKALLPLIGFDAVKKRLSGETA